MALDGIVEVLRGRQGEDVSLTDGFEDISGGVEAELGTGSGDSQAATLYLATEGAVDVTLQFSPDGGGTWREPKKESPISFGGAGEDIVYVEYTATDVRLSGSNGTGVDADLRVIA